MLHLHTGSLICYCCCSVARLCLTLQSHGLQHVRPPHLSPSPRVCPSSCTLNQWCHPTISSSVTLFSFCLQSFPASGSFSKESVLHIRWPKYCSFSFSISPSNEYSGLISSTIDWFDLLTVQGTLESCPAPQFKSISSSALCLLLWSNSHLYMNPGKTIALAIQIFVGKVMCFLLNTL